MTVVSNRRVESRTPAFAAADFDDFVPTTRAEARALQEARAQEARARRARSSAPRADARAEARTDSRATTRGEAPRGEAQRTRSARHTRSARPDVPPVPIPGTPDTPAALLALVADESAPPTRAARRAAAASRASRRAPADRPRHAGTRRSSRTPRTPLAVTRPIVGALALAGVLTGAQAATGGAPVSASLASSGDAVAAGVGVANAELMLRASRSSQRDSVQDETTEAAAVRTEREQSDAATRAAVAAQAAADAAAAKAAAEAEARRLAYPIDSQINSGFGWRTNPFGYGSSMHAGVDFSGQCGTEIHAAAAGTVVESAWTGGYGWRVVIQHAAREGHDIRTTYNHMQQPGVGVGTVMAKGDVVGYVGSTGDSTGCHLHFEVQYDGTPVDPMPYF